MVTTACSRSGSRPQREGAASDRRCSELALAAIEAQRLVTIVTAVTHPDNLASIHAFEQVGFRRREISEDSFVVLELRLG